MFKKAKNLFIYLVIFLGVYLLGVSAYAGNLSVTWLNLITIALWFILSFFFVFLETANNTRGNILLTIMKGLSAWGVLIAVLGVISSIIVSFLDGKEELAYQIALVAPTYIICFFGLFWALILFENVRQANH